MISHMNAIITADATLLDIVSKWPATDAVFRRYDEKAGVCLCCSCLFDTLEEISKKYSLDLNSIMREINDVLAGEKPPCSKKYSACRSLE